MKKIAYFLSLILIVSGSSMLGIPEVLSDVIRSDLVGTNTGIGTPWGTWSNTVYCPPSTWAGGYSMRVEPSQRNNDDTAMNAIELQCYDRNGHLVQSISPHPGYWGTWGRSVGCSTNNFFTHFRLKVEGRLPPGEDDTSVNSVAFRCSDGATVEGGNGGPFGRWEEWRFPPNNNSAICGVRAKTEASQGSGDDTALNNLEFSYCLINGVTPPQACPPNFSPAAFQGRTGRVAFYNEWDVPVTVILYHPNTRSVYNRYTVPPRQNQFLGNNIIVGDDWGVCFENKPGASGFVNNLGTISDYNPNYQGIPLFMIQNGRIR